MLTFFNHVDSLLGFTALVIGAFYHTWFSLWRKFFSFNSLAIFLLCSEEPRSDYRRSPVRAEHEIYVGNYPVKFREADVRKLFEESGVSVGAIRMKMDGLKV